MSKYTKQWIVHDKTGGGYVRRSFAKEITKAEYKKVRKIKGAKVTKNKVLILSAPERVHKLSDSVAFYVYEKQRKRGAK